MADIPPTRASLLLRLRDSHDGDAWRQFVGLYAPLIYQHARKQGLQDADALDLAQDVLRAVASAVALLQYDPQRGTFRSWLFTIVRRKLSNWRRAQKGRPRGSGDTGTQQWLEQCPAAAQTDADWDGEWQQRQYAWACEQIRRDVSAATWQAFWRTAIDGQPGKKVAADLGLTIAAVYHARCRVLARLKELVQSVQEA
jgi:RNA polymerase sigma-70 factor (ECF subfamily)